MRWFLGIFLLIGLALALQAGLVAFAGYVLLGVFLLSRYLAKNWIASLAAEREVDTEPREVGEETEVLVQVKNEGKLLIPWVLTEDLLPDRALRKPAPALTIKGSRLRVLFLRSGTSKLLKYKITFTRRGYYAIGPVALETGDVFGLHRRHKVLTEARFVMVYPRMLPITKYDFASERPIGEIRLANRLFEDPTRTAGVRPYVVGDPLQRIHWRATARTGQLHCRVYEPTLTCWGKPAHRLPRRRLPEPWRALSVRTGHHDGRIPGLRRLRPQPTDRHLEQRPGRGRSHSGRVLANGRRIEGRRIHDATASS